MSKEWKTIEHGWGEAEQAYDSVHTAQIDFTWELISTI